MNSPVAGRTLIAGFAVVVAGFLYDIRFAGVPFQDPTPLLTASYERHALIASLIRGVGLGCIALGIALRLPVIGRSRTRCAITGACIALLTAAALLWLHLGGKPSVIRADGIRVPLSVYAPRVEDCVGIAIISPGGGATEDSFAYLARPLARAGYLAVVVGHRESGPRALQAYIDAANGNRGVALGRMVADPVAYTGRARDVAAARHWAAARCVSRYAVLLGHSMGATTVMIEAGARNRLGVAGGDAFDAYVAMSPQGAGLQFLPDAWSDIRRPMLLLTGTRDGSPGVAAGDSRAEAFRGLPAGCAWFGLIDGATHLDFTGGESAAHVRERVPRTVTAFLAAARGHDCTRPPQFPGMALSAK